MNMEHVEDVLTNKLVVVTDEEYDIMNDLRVQGQLPLVYFGYLKILVVVPLRRETSALFFRHARLRIEQR